MLSGDKKSDFARPGARSSTVQVERKKQRKLPSLGQQLNDELYDSSTIIFLTEVSNQQEFVEWYNIVNGSEKIEFFYDVKNAHYNRPFFIPISLHKLYCLANCQIY